MKKTILFLGNDLTSMLHFRWEFMKVWIKKGWRVKLCVPFSDEQIPKFLANESQVDLVNINLQRTKTNLLSDFMFFIKIWKITRKIQPDIILNYTIKPVIYGGIAARLAGVKRTYAFITGLGYVFIGDGFKKKLLRAFVSLLYRFSLKCSQGVFFLNNTDQQEFLSRHLVNREKTILISGEGVDSEYYAVRPLPDVPLSFLFVGRLIQDKGIMEYVTAAQLLKKRYPDVLFKIVGGLDDNPSGITQKTLQNWTDEGAIEYLGYLNDVRPAIENSSVFVLPSYREGLPRSTLEAMSMGRPVVTTDAPGCRDTVEEGVNGYLVPVKDGPALAKVMEYFILDSSLLGRFGKASRQLVEEKYEVHKVNQRILDVIQEENT